MTIKTRTTNTQPESVTAKPRSYARKSKVESIELGSAGNPEGFGTEHNQVSLDGLDRPVTGRAVFAVRTLGNAVSVESAFIEENGDVLRLPGVFPNRQYAIEQIDELRQIVNQHFDELEKIALINK